jgi:hypothetical protein
MQRGLRGGYCLHIRHDQESLMQPTRLVWLSTGTLLIGLGLASLVPSAPAPASASQAPRSAQVLDPTLQALATQAALAATQAALIPTPNPTQLTQAINQAGAITIQGSLQIDGPVSVSGMYTTQLLNIGGIRPDVVSCATFAQGTRNVDGTGFAVPGPSLSATIDGHSVLIPVSVSPYPGPNTYGLDQGLQLGAGVVIDDTNYLVVGEDQTASVTVDPDGSGSFVFSGLHSGSLATGTVSADAIAGQLSWTCSPQP